MANLEELSESMYQLLDCTGYSHNIVQTRRTVYRNLGQLFSTHWQRKFVLSGSKGEGMTKSYESDTDTLMMAKDMVCVDDVSLVHHVPDHMTVFATVDAPSGYCMMELLRQGKDLSCDMFNCLVPYDRTLMLSSQVLGTEVFKNHLTACSTKTGPAVTNSIGGGLTQDHVYTIPCHCQSILKQWSNRPRGHDWPSSSLRQQVLQMTGNLVATGLDGSKTEHLEWRYCFNEIEMLIISTLNDTQLKLYRLLKIINNDILKQRGLSLTSFIMKNTVLWLAETHPQSQFVPKTLFHWLWEAMKQLKQSIEANNIPYYMIPDRDLLKEKVKELDRPKLIQVITDVIESGPMMLSECRTIRKYIALTPSDLTVLKQKIELLELCELKLRYLNMYLAFALTNGRENRANTRLVDALQWSRKRIIRHGWPRLVQKQIDLCLDESMALMMLLS